MNETKNIVEEANDPITSLNGRIHIKVRKDLFISADDSCKVEKEDVEYKCTVCAKKFTTKKKLYLHNRFHNKTIKCQHEGCDRKFANKSDLDKHFRIHTGERPFECDICNRRFRQKGTLKSHKVIVHNFVYDENNSFNETKSVKLKRSICDETNIEHIEENFSKDVNSNMSRNDTDTHNNTINIVQPVLPDLIPVQYFKPPNKNNTQYSVSGEYKNKKRRKNSDDFGVKNIDKSTFFSEHSIFKSSLLFESSQSSDSEESLICSTSEATPLVSYIKFETDEFDGTETRSDCEFELNC